MESRKYKVELEIFEGPLDLLLYLVKRDEIAIHEVALARITEQYLSYLDTFEQLNINLASEFVVMAANLLLLKSASLIPQAGSAPRSTNEEDDPRWDLIRQLIEYKKFKQAASFLASQAQEKSREFPYRRAASVTKDPAGGPEPLAPIKADALQLLEAFQAVLKRLEPKIDRHAHSHLEPETVTVAEKIQALTEALSRTPSLSLSSLLSTSSTREERITLFLALLELMKQGRVAIEQTERCADIHVEARSPQVEFS